MVSCCEVDSSIRSYSAMKNNESYSKMRRIGGMRTAVAPGVVAMLTVVLFASCRMQELAYMKDAPRDSAVAFEAQFSKGIQANDLLNIYVESETPEATIRFNQETNKIAVSDGTVLNNSAASREVPGYLVSADGDIIFPVLGKIRVLGLTHDSLAHMLQRRLVEEGHIKDPVVTVKLMNFKVSVLGEVAKPGQLMVQGERLTILEALSMVGDLTIYGMRNNVTVLREENGQRVLGNVDLTSRELTNSPYYYLHQNDVIIVEPNEKRKRSGDRDNTWMSYVSMAITSVSTVVMMIYYATLTNRYRQ